MSALGWVNSHAARGNPGIFIITKIPWQPECVTKPHNQGFNFLTFPVQCTLLGIFKVLSNPIHPSLFGIAHEAPLALEEPAEVLRPRVRVVPQEQLQDERPHDGGGVDAVAGEGTDPLSPAPIVNGRVIRLMTPPSR